MSVPIYEELVVAIDHMDRNRRRTKGLTMDAIVVCRLSKGWLFFCVGRPRKNMRLASFHEAGQGMSANRGVLEPWSKVEFKRA
mmetsp:Transcript_77152/g.208310  ORF Transcript_77152/g.208310 Transcript_77152/m.208310 type:complete len:83 (+) Transcript_77152:1916-2164(+)